MSTIKLPPLDRIERVVQFLRDNAGNNSFFMSVLKQYDRFGRLSEKQMSAVERNMSTKRVH